MNQTVLANLVWSHIGHQFTALNDNSAESKIFSSVYDTARRTIILKVAPESFTMPFIPSKLSEESLRVAERDALNREEWQIFAYPTELIQLYTNRTKNRLNSTIDSLGGIFGSSGIMRPAYSKSLNKRVLLYSGTEDSPVREGIIDIPIELWNDQIIETLALYMAWMISPAIQVGVQKRRDLKKEYMESKMETISVNNFEGDKEPLIQESSITNIIDFNQDFNLNFYIDNVL